MKLMTTSRQVPSLPPVVLAIYPEVGCVPCRCTTVKEPLSTTDLKENVFYGIRRE